MKQFAFPRSARLRSRQEFLKVQRNGQKQHLANFLVFLLPQPGSCRENPLRMGVTVTRKVGNAVKRNRIKRLLREAFRHRRSYFPSGWDMVWIAKRQTGSLSFQQVERDMDLLLKRAKWGSSLSGKRIT